MISEVRAEAIVGDGVVVGEQHHFTPAHVEVERVLECVSVQVEVEAPTIAVGVDLIAANRRLLHRHEAGRIAGRSDD